MINNKHKTCFLQQIGMKPGNNTAVAKKYQPLVLFIHRMAAKRITQ
jgi:hypothetical protein